MSTDQQAESGTRPPKVVAFIFKTISDGEWGIYRSAYEDGEVKRPVIGPGRTFYGLVDEEDLRP
jgi:hypothetical protein